MLVAAQCLCSSDVASCCAHPHRRTARRMLLHGDATLPLYSVRSAVAALQTCVWARQVSQHAATGGAAGAHGCAVALRASLSSLRLLSVALHCCALRALFVSIRPLRFSTLARREYSRQLSLLPSTEERPSLCSRCVCCRRAIHFPPPSSPSRPRRIVLASSHSERSSCTSY